MKSLAYKIVNKLVNKLNSFCNREEYPSDEAVITLFEKRDLSRVYERIRHKKQINVAFFCMSVPMFKYEEVFRIMQEDPYFNPIFFIAPRKGNIKNLLNEVSAMEMYCKDNRFPYVKLKNKYLNIGQDVSIYNIDIAFYSQPYTRICCKEYYYDKLKDSLLCYTPYGYLISYTKHNYLSVLNLIAWKNFMPTSVSVRVAKEFNPSYNNLYYLGYTGYDSYCKCKEYHWKSSNKKHVIWAPHHSIASKGWLHLSCFLDIYEYMIDLVKKYEKEIEFVFKPHPHLYPALCQEWGQQKADDYYNRWRSMPNTSINEGNAYEIFKSSDALIHDCGSFLLDYMFTKKPCLYIAFSGKLNVETAEDGTDAYNAHYHAYKKVDIEKFLQDIVCDGKDDMMTIREAVLNKYIKPENGYSASRNIVNNIKDSLQLN
ncbi:CDP-glycerol glycerophosphotransferase family protein [Xylanibacter ruminicola]|uniref:CDP-Glycerol:Poly(Glycerophosphate) glycerophosphotransferase n=1 Tax=Xylanibacter ruminicola (strain ATCC 19189 / DSM 19721 / CIP 105475 / JCM 8958 / 23) TaxID=264731 RepID=D5ETV4_XYLR2|nr:CDP-glycerol glycerophosphotransferase family protein [Xylanibacter ruminicola]ADE82334.1 conserved hypothetical protein [Xylanibacter ruminicola 23]